MSLVINFSIDKWTESSIQYQNGMELRDRKMTKDCAQPLRIGNIRALNGCAGRLFGAATLHNLKVCFNSTDEHTFLFLHS